MSGLLRIEVDGLPVEVDPDEWGSDPERVAAEVRAARAELRLPELDDADREPDYTALYGKDA